MPDNSYRHCINNVPTNAGLAIRRHCPQAPESAINSAVNPPDIGIVMRHPASCAIHIFSRFLAGYRQALLPFVKMVHAVQKGLFFLPASNSFLH